MYVFSDFACQSPPFWESITFIGPAAICLVLLFSFMAYTTRVIITMTAVVVAVLMLLNLYSLKLFL